MRKLVLYTKKIMCMLMTMLLLVSSGITVVADDNESYDTVYTGIDQLGHHHDGELTSVVLLRDIDGGISHAYCVDYETEIAENSLYSRCDVEDSDYYTDENAAHIRAIVRNSHPFIKMNELIKRSKIYNLTETDAITGTQLAIWHYSNGKNFDFNFNEKKVEKLYNFLINLEPIYNPSTGIANIDIKSSITQKGSKSELDIYYKPDSTNADGSNITLNYEFSKDIKSVYNAEIGSTFVDSDGYTHLPIKNLPLDFDFNFKVYGTQNVKFDAYFYNPLGGREKSQSLIGAHIGDTNIKNSIDISYNLPKPGKLTINKLDEISLKPISGVTFEISDTQSFEKILYTIKTDENGTAIIDDLPLCTLYIRESAPREGYIQNKEVITFNIVSGDNFITLKNTPYGKLNITKTDDNLNPIENVTFSLYSGEKIDKEHLLCDNLVTNKEGNITVNNLTPGKYTIIETSAPDGYHINKTPAAIDVAPGNTAKITLTNNKEKLASIGILKLDEDTENQIAGAVFSIYSDEKLENKIADVTTRLDSPAFLDNLPKGRYFIKETSSPLGYLLNDEVKDIYLKEGESTTITFYDEKAPCYSRINIYNYDIKTNEQLQGAIFAIYSDENFESLITEVTSLADAPAILDNLTDGIYYIKQIKAPDGYLLDAQPQTVELSQGKTQNVYFYNTKDYPTAGNFGIYLVLGISILAVGGTLLFINIKKLNKKPQE